MFPSLDCFLLPHDLLLQFSDHLVFLVELTLKTLEFVYVHLGVSEIFQLVILDNYPIIEISNLVLLALKLVQKSLRVCIFVVSLHTLFRLTKRISALPAISDGFSSFHF